MTQAIVDKLLESAADACEWADDMAEWEASASQAQEAMEKHVGEDVDYGARCALAFGVRQYVVNRLYHPYSGQMFTEERMVEELRDIYRNFYDYFAAEKDS